ncbi:MAG: SIR2 family protein [Candidatus Nitrosopumilus sp. bin_7KS]
MKIALFLGAGASKIFGKPTTVEMRDKLRKYGTLSLDEVIFQSFFSPHEHKDIEYVLQSIRDIIKFSKSLGGKYFSNHTKNTYLNFDSNNIQYSKFFEHLENVEKELEREIYETYRWNHDFDNELLSVYDEIFNFLKIHSESITVFTTNYDRSVEEYCNLRSSFNQLIDGFSRDPPYSEFSVWDGNYDIKTPESITPIRLFKLHGSLNWKDHKTHGIIKTSETKIDDPNIIRHIAIMPTRTPKDEEETSPYADLLNIFSNRMEQHDACIVIGFSFRDYQINRVFQEFMSKRKPLICISPTAMEDMCENLVRFPIPQDYDKSKVSSQVPRPGGHVWAIPHLLSIENISHDLSIALSHINAILEENKKTLERKHDQN